MGVVFDKLGFMRKLEGEDGFTRPQAERLTDALYDAVIESVATKQDLSEVRAEIKDVRVEIKDVRMELGALRNEFKAEVAQLKVWAAGTGVAVVSVLSAIRFFR